FIAEKSPPLAVYQSDEREIQRELRKYCLYRTRIGSSAIHQKYFFQKACEVVKPYVILRHRVLNI
ncbi:MAG: hypothetical protein C7B46_20890, partial [Sulfobacillus benefaciens]